MKAFRSTIVVGALVCCGLAVAALRDRRADSNSHVRQSARSPAHEGPTSTRPDSKLQSRDAEIEQLRRELRTIRARLVDHDESQPVRDEGRRDGDAPLEREHLSDEEVLRRAAEEADEMTIFYESSFEAERRDTDWAYDHEQEIGGFFAGEHLEGNHLDNVVCRDTLCRVEVAHASETSRERVATLWGQGPFAHGGYTRYYPDENRSVWFVGREGHPFQQPPSAKPNG